VLFCRASAANPKARLKSNNYKVRMAQRDEERRKKAIVAELKAEKQAERTARIESQRRRNEQRQANTVKSSKVQIIKDTAKIKKMSKRQRKLVMTSAQFQKLGQF